MHTRPIKKESGSNVACHLLKYSEYFKKPEDWSSSALAFVAPVQMKLLKNAVTDTHAESVLSERKIPVRCFQARLDIPTWKVLSYVSRFNNISWHVIWARGPSWHPGVNLDRRLLCPRSAYGRELERLRPAVPHGSFHINKHTQLLWYSRYDVFLPTARWFSVHHHISYVDTLPLFIKTDESIKLKETNERRKNSANQIFL